MTRRMITAIAVILMVAGLATAPASADPPVEFSLTDTIQGVDPCTGAPHVVTIHRTVRAHTHANNMVFQVSNTGSTNSGYTMDHGLQHATVVNGVARLIISDQWRAEDGRKYHVTNQLLIDVATGTTISMNFTARCIGQSA